MNVNYYEICIGQGPEESSNDSWMCIKGTRQPTIEEVEKFCASDIAMFGGHVLGVYPMTREEAERFYDFENEANWPVFGA